MAIMLDHRDCGIADHGSKSTMLSEDPRIPSTAWHATILMLFFLAKLLHVPSNLGNHFQAQARKGHILVY